MLKRNFVLALAGLAVAAALIIKLKSKKGSTESFVNVPRVATRHCSATSSVCARESVPLQDGWGGDRAGSRLNNNPNTRAHPRMSAGPMEGLKGTVLVNRHGKGLPEEGLLAGPAEHSFDKERTRYGAEFYGQLLAPGDHLGPEKARNNSPGQTSEQFEAPVGDMINGSLDDTRIVADRLMIANQKSRLRNQGDHIRGDLAIVPERRGWFQVSARPEIDLLGGALHVIAGVSNAQGQAVSDMIVRESGGTIPAVAGVVVNPTNIQGTSFPASHQ